MKTKQWVQHISGQGERWEVAKLDAPGDAQFNVQWVVEDKAHREYLHYLPKSEYRLCDPPEQWEDVTAECDSVESAREIPKHFCGGIARRSEMLFERNSIHGMSYRLRKIEVNFIGKDRTHGCEKGMAFIVERRKT